MDALKAFCKQLPYNLSKQDTETLQEEVQAWVKLNPPLFSSSTTSDGFILTFDTEGFVADLVAYMASNELIVGVLAEYDPLVLDRLKG